MYITCPRCNFSKDVPKHKIPPQTRSVVCPRCKNKFPFTVKDNVFAAAAESPSPEMETSFQPSAPGFDRRFEEEAPKPAPQKEGIAWESLSSEGMWRSLFRTIKNVLFSPGNFFTALSPSGKRSYPLAFAVITGGAGQLLTLFWQYLIASPSFRYLDEAWIAWMGAGSFVILTLFIPILVIISLYIGTILVHLGLIILRGNNYPFRATFKVLAYSHAAQLFNLVPMVGAVVGGIWGIILAVIGLSTMHHISKLKAFFALFIVLFLLTAVGIAMSIVLAFTMGTFGTAV